ncbi:MAG: hypothetical protein H6721_15720 [Sandaracinus sp.]|nr:hypothetical protein [Sandaracinus sp.]
MTRVRVSWALVLLLGACGGDDDAPPDDASVADATVADTSTGSDAGGEDASAPDAGEHLRPARRRRPLRREPRERHGRRRRGHRARAGRRRPRALVLLKHGFQLATSNYATSLERLASHGFVVVGVDSGGGLFGGPTNAAERDAAIAAIDWATSTAPFASRVDATRIAVPATAAGARSV